MIKCRGVIIMRKRAATAAERAYLLRYGIPAETLGDDCIVKEYQPGECLCEDGTPVTDLQFLFKGKARACVQSSEGEQLILCLYDGSGVIDDMELFLNDGICHITCIASEAVSALSISIERNRNLLLASNAFLQATCRSFASSLLRNRNHFNNLLYPLEHRLCCYIAGALRGSLWSDNLTRVGEILGVSYRHLSRTLKVLCDNGILRKEEKGYRVLDLKAFAQTYTEFYTLVEENSQLHGAD